jgi:uncharacterized protein involved in exopolysaccharide biosynthesis
MEVHGPEDVSLVALGRLVLRHRRLVLGIEIFMFVLVTGFTLFQRRSYTSTAAFMPQASSENALSRYSGIAAQFGFNLPTEDAGSSPAFYADLLKSRDVLRDIVLTPFVIGARGDSVRGTLVELYRVKGDSPAARRDAAVRRLREKVSATTGRETGLVILEVTTSWASLSQQVASRMIRLVSDFNMQTRQTRAGAERRFIEGRLGEAKDSLKAAEDRLQVFLQRNRDYRNAPQLTFEYDRFQREVTTQQQLFTSLAQEYEQARIDEVRNTPVITLVEAPNLPTKPDPRRTLLKGLLSLVAGFLVATFLVTVRQAFGGLLAPQPVRGRPAGPAPIEEVAPRPSVAQGRGSARVHGDS